MPVQPNDSSSTLCVSGPSQTQSGNNINSNEGASDKQQHNNNGSGPSSSKNSHHVTPLNTSVSSPNLLNASAVFSSGSCSESEVSLGIACLESPVMCENNE
jgi:hypothetical protein